MASVDDYDFSKGDAGAELMVNSEAGQIRVGGYYGFFCYLLYTFLVLCSLTGTFA